MCKTHFDSGRKCVAMVTAYYGKNWGEILHRELLPQFFTNSHEIWHRCLPLGVDVQDTFFDSGRKCVVVTAYYTVKKYCGAGVLITFSDISSLHILLYLCRVHSSPTNLSVPPLPPKTKNKQRNSIFGNSSDDGVYTAGSNNNNAPLSRSFSGSSMSVTSQQSDLSNTSTHSRPDSTHSTQLSSIFTDDGDTSTTATDHSFDYGRGLSVYSGHSEGAVSPANIGQTVYSVSTTKTKSMSYYQETRFINGGYAGESSGEDCTLPPALPAKTKPRAERQLSGYDNLSQEEADALSQKLQEDVFISEPAKPDVVECAMQKAKFTSSGDIDLRHDSDNPPPLPPKANKHSKDCCFSTLLTRWRRFDFAITCISHRPQPEYTRD